MKYLIIALTLLSVAFGQEMVNQLENNQQFQQMIDQSLSLRSAEVPTEQKSNQGQTFIITGQQHPNYEQPQHVQTIKVVEPQHEKVVVKLENGHKEHLIVEQGHHHQHQHPQVVKVVEHHKKPVAVTTHECHMFGQKGQCVSVPSYIGCMVKGGILFMSFSECGFNPARGCCVPNMIPFLSSSQQQSA